MITHFYESFFVTIFVGIIFVGFAKNAHDLFISRVERIGKPAGNLVNERRRLSPSFLAAASTFDFALSQNVFNAFP